MGQRLGEGVSRFRMAPASSQQGGQLLPGCAIVGLFRQARAQAFFQPRLIGGRERGWGRLCRARLLPHAALSILRLYETALFVVYHSSRLLDTPKGKGRLDGCVVSRRAPRYGRIE